MGGPWTCRRTSRAFYCSTLPRTWAASTCGPLVRPLRMRRWMPPNPSAMVSLRCAVTWHLCEGSRPNWTDEIPPVPQQVDHMDGCFPPRRCLKNLRMSTGLPEPSIPVQNIKLHVEDISRSWVLSVLRSIRRMVGWCWASMRGPAVWPSYTRAILGLIHRTSLRSFPMQYLHLNTCVTQHASQRVSLDTSLTRMPGNRRLNLACMQVCGVYGSWHLGQLQVGLSRAIRLAQCCSVRITALEALPMQIDGEPWHQPPATLDISLKGQVRSLPAALCTVLSTHGA